MVSKLIHQISENSGMELLLTIETAVQAFTSFLFIKGNVPAAGGIVSDYKLFNPEGRRQRSDIGGH